MPRRFDLFNIRVPDEKVHLANRRMAQQGVQEAFIRGKEPVMTLPTAGRNGKNCADGKPLADRLAGRQLAHSTMRPSG